jgi:hypothetical protein
MMPFGVHVLPVVLKYRRAQRVQFAGNKTEPPARSGLKVALTKMFIKALGIGE